MQLGLIARAQGARLLSLAETDSTNDEARRLIETGERGPLWIVAARQTKGRGRLGREWISPEGNLYASFVFSDFPETRLAPQLGFVTGVAAMRALGASAGQGSFKLKWPNDMLFDSAKLGGILLEGVSGGATPVAIIGIGMNIAHAPEDLPYPARALSDLGAGAPTAASVFARLTDSLCAALDVWRRGEGFDAIREEWLRSAHGLGERIRVALAGSETIEGVFETIDATGRLMLLTDQGRRAIDAGDVLVGPRAAGAGA
ncbi:MAG: biotin--[acetyl-CoA-carboxylase] ligase [Methylocystis sp.]|uniref:biotin--[acetyl-CoA-carboxylase] ligase n=1 Tax=Methylocystis sp. TaxID=1911079 RepID=UPI003DA3EB9B